MRTSQGEQKPENCQLCNRHHNLDEHKTFNDMVVAERSKFLAKQEFCYGCYESISSKYTARNCPKKKEEHVRYDSGSIPLTYLVSSVKRKMGQQK